MAEVTPQDVELGRLLYQAKLAEQAERYDDMANLMDEIISIKKSLDPEEQKLFSIAYKNCVGRIRTAWRLAETARSRYAGANNQKETFAAEYAKDLGVEIVGLCQRVETNLKCLASSAKDVDTKLMYAKLEADYKRYRCEINPEETKAASDAYVQAASLGNTLSPSHPTRMALALNYSVFKYEIEHKWDEALKFADEALTQARSSGVPHSREAFLTEQLLQDNVSLWRSEQSNNEQDVA